MRICQQRKYDGRVNKKKLAWRAKGSITPPPLVTQNFFRRLSPWLSRSRLFLGSSIHGVSLAVPRQRLEMVIHSCVVEYCLPECGRGQVGWKRSGSRVLCQAQVRQESNRAWDPARLMNLLVYCSLGSHCEHHILLRAPALSRFKNRLSIGGKCKQRKQNGTIATGGGDKAQLLSQDLLLFKKHSFGIPMGFLLRHFGAVQ